MTKCDICGKGTMIGHMIRHNHSGQWEKRASKTRKIFLPNLHKGKVLVNGVTMNVRACASCLRKYRVPYEKLIKTMQKFLEVEEIKPEPTQIEVAEGKTPKQTSRAEKSP